ncbi:MAG: hypothetical protein RL088_3657 [Verrucomicrobiota bacterium]|jgi:phosphoribosylanthranilate isomerase
MILPTSRTAVKVCGITREADAIAAVEAGVDFLGFNTWSGTKRFIDIEQNGAWIAKLRVPRIALLINASREFAARIAALPFIDALQLHGDEDAEECARIAALGKPIIKAVRANDPAVAGGAAGFSTNDILLDAHVPGEFGGTGARVDLQLARRFREENPTLRVWLAGGLKPENVANAITVVRPAVVDVASGVETAPAIKNAQMMRDFIAAARSA